LNAEPALAIRNLHKRFGEVTALRGVEFTLAPGEVFGYLGPNGAGKTTTLRIIVGLVRADRGSVLLNGRPLTHRERVDIGFMPGDLNLYPDMKALAALDYFARFRPERPPVLRPQLLQALNLDTDTLERRIKFLSHGTRKKLGLIIALQHDPPVLLLDEPSAGLDPLVQQEFKKALLDFAARGRAVLFSSHVLTEVEDVCDRVAVIRAGEIVAIDTIDNLRRQSARLARIRFRNGVPAELATLPGVQVISTNDQEVGLRLRGDLQPLLQLLAREDPSEVIMPEPQLEDVFLGYYGEHA
jgi:ABC-2 type transport system ATP-binding protein